MPSQFTARRWVRNKGPLMEEPAGGLEPRAIPEDWGRKKGVSSVVVVGCSGRAGGGRGQAHRRDSKVRGAPPPRLLLASAPPRRNAHDPRSAGAGRATGRGRGGLLAMRDQFSRILFHRRGSGCGCIHTYIHIYMHVFMHVYTRTRARAERVRPDSRFASALHLSRYRARARLERYTCQISSIARTPTLTQVTSLFFFPISQRCTTLLDTRSKQSNPIRVMKFLVYFCKWQFKCNEC